ncbi:hypothetical protein J3B02_002191 [Coemansia erecta]|uniref:Sulfite oxidase n=1 Tax=Coemansia asiatica TaxID=1052880 RepID=A0A9W7XLA9_9FUNG|nr:hypothetical protein LPJ64_002599 [Coemansia asiatica]KAJ2855392.1 hypothetical protein J3B02_002191 [Coemansia erecta]KAJ2882918.1 hypothetical protein FB639_002288 [Coemansia asiatica]
MSTTADNGSYADEPWADRSLENYVVRAKCPFNAEVKLDKLVEHFVTPTERHFRRNHGPIPNIDEKAWSMIVEINTQEPTARQSTHTVTLADLQRLRQFEVVAVLECAGNRRDGLKAIKPVNGVIWGAGTASNSQWAGCRLRDVLVAAGVPANLCDPFYETPRHVEFAAYGEASDDAHYASSIPLSWVMNPLNMVLVATEMNGKPLLRDHGFPARIVAPGIIGARWVKWLKYIRVQDYESDCFYQKRDYKILPPMANESNCESFWPRFPALMELNVQSAICRPAPDEQLVVGMPYLARGYALTGGGRAVDRVEISLDDGTTWDLAQVFCISPKQRSIANSSSDSTQTEDDNFSNSSSDGSSNSDGSQRDWSAKQWSWVLWSYQIDSVPANCAISCRAWDSGGNTQPAAAVWNYRGVMNNSVFRVRPQVKSARGSKL